MSGFAQLTKDGDDFQEISRPIILSELHLGQSPCPRGAYLHVPFCFHKCHYCDFYSIVDSQDRQAAFTDRMLRELSWTGDRFTAPLETLFVGGGTPTLLAAEYWRRLLHGIHGSLSISAGAEITVEANPETVSEELVDILRSGGVNRVSVGAQTFDKRHLATLERWHEPESVERAVDKLRIAGMVSINLDLIFAIPGQSMADWQRDLERAIACGADHLSCYALTYEPNTPMTKRMQRGAFEPAPDELEATMYEEARRLLAAAGFEQYEISAWAKPGHRCRHNLLYWTNEDWWAIGPSASGHVNGVRWKNTPRLTAYLESKDAPPIVDVEQLDRDSQVGEVLMMGLRLIEGVPRERVEELLSQGDRGEMRRKAIDRHVTEGLLAFTDNRLRLTDRGRLLADSVLVDLI